MSIPVLFPGEKEECLVFAVVEMRDAHGSAERAAEVVLAISRLASQSFEVCCIRWIGLVPGCDLLVVIPGNAVLEVGVPGHRVQSFVAKKLEHRAVIAVRTRLRGETLNAARRMSKLRGWRGGCDLELCQRFDCGSGLIKCSARIRALRAYAIKKDFGTEILATGKF